MSTTAAALPPLTDAQREVVLANDDRLLVGAGAGSGKTSTVVQKICFLLGARVRDMSGAEYRHPTPIALGDIAAITFTNEAAADLKRKLRAALAAAGMRALALDVDSARIGTIHGFCGDLLRDFALRAGHPPVVSVLTDAETGALALDSARVALQRAVADGHVAHFDQLLASRSLTDVVQLVATMASDSDRLSMWHANRQVLREHERALLVLANDARDLRLAELTRIGAMDFDRMIVSVRDLLRHDASVRHAVQRQVRVLIIDEFQDVDPAQRDLAYLLGGLEVTDPTPSRIVLVGDPKQSIYRFRRADVSLWNAVAERMRDGSIGRHLELTDNFRSRPEILAFVDATVGELLAAPIAPGDRRTFEVDYVRLDATVVDADESPAVEVIAVHALPNGKSPNVGAVRQAEATAVAERIAALHAAGEEFGSMAVLLTGFSDVSIYRDALRAREIPMYVLRSVGFWETREVLDCVLALRAIRDANDDVATVGFLRGPFVGMRDDTVFALRNARHPDGLRGALSSAPAEPLLCERATQLLTTLSALRDRVPVHDVLQRLLAETGFLAFLRQDPERGPQAIGNIHKLRRIAAAAAALSLGEFLREVGTARQGEDRVGEERLYRARADVVTITTVHSAKGLEWPIVFWCDLVRDTKPLHDKLLCGRAEFRLKLEVEGDEERGAPADQAHDSLKSELRLEHTAEAYRLWYVATTRAKRLLVLSGVPLGTLPGTSMANALRTRFPALTAPTPPARLTCSRRDGSAFSVPVRTVSVQTAASATVPSIDRVPVPDDLRSIVAPPALRVPVGRSRLSATQLMSFNHDTASWWRRYVLGVDEAGQRSAADAVLHGVIVHEVLERFNRDLTDIDELITTAIAHHGTDEAQHASLTGQLLRTRVRELVSMAASTPEWAALSHMPSARRELTFTRVLADGSVIDGALDLVGVRDGVARVLDVKTGQPTSDDAMRERYRVQAAVYAEAVTAIAKRPTTVALVSALDQRVIEVDAGQTVVAELVARLRGTVGTPFESIGCVVTE